MHVHTHIFTPGCCPVQPQSDLLATEQQLGLRSLAQGYSPSRYTVYPNIWEGGMLDPIAPETHNFFIPAHWYCNVGNDLVVLRDVITNSGTISFYVNLKLQHKELWLFRFYYCNPCHSPSMRPLKTPWIFPIWVWKFNQHHIPLPMTVFQEKRNYSCVSLAGLFTQVGIFFPVLFFTVKLIQWP